MTELAEMGPLFDNNFIGEDPAEPASLFVPAGALFQARCLYSDVSRLKWFELADKGDPPDSFSVLRNRPLDLHHSMEFPPVIGDGELHAPRHEYPRVDVLQEVCPDSPD